MHQIRRGLLMSAVTGLVLKFKSTESRHCEPSPIFVCFVISWVKFTSFLICLYIFYVHCLYIMFTFRTEHIEIYVVVLSVLLLNVISGYITHELFSRF